MSNTDQGDNSVKKEVGYEELIALLIDCNMPDSHINKILNLLRNFTNPEDVRSLPEDFDTLVKMYQHEE